MSYLAIDQHRKQLTVNLRNEQGDVLVKRQVSTEWPRVRSFLEEVRNTSVPEDGFVAILEVCGFNDWLLKLLAEYGCRETILIQPEKRSKKKTDRRDAYALALTPCDSCRKEEGSMKNLCFVAVAFTVVLGLAGIAQAAMPGAPPPDDPFKFTFDEWGNGFYQLENPVTGQYESPTASPGFFVGGFLTYQLPDEVVPGDVGVLEPGSNDVLSDGLRFLPNDFDVVSWMQFYSDKDDAVLAPADTGFPGDFAPSYTCCEIGPEGANYFVYGATGETGAVQNVYFGISDGKIPEPATIVVWSLLGAIGIAVVRWQRRR